MTNSFPRFDDHGGIEIAGWLVAGSILRRLLGQDQFSLSGNAKPILGPTMDKSKFASPGK